MGDVLEEVGVREVGDLLEVEVGSPLHDRREVAPVGADDDGDLGPRQVVRRDIEAVCRGGERWRADDPHAVHRAIDVAAEGDLRLGGQLVEDLEEPAGLVGVILGHRSSWLVGARRGSVAPVSEPSSLVTMSVVMCPRYPIVIVRATLNDRAAYERHAWGECGGRVSSPETYGSPCLVPLLNGVDGCGRHP